MGSGKSKPAKPKPKEDAKVEVAVLEPDEIIDCFDDTDDTDLGFKYIIEKEADIVKDIRMTNGFFDATENMINKKLMYPVTYETIKHTYEQAYMDTKEKEIHNFFKYKQNIDFTDEEMKTFTDAEVFNPLLSKNKYEYIKLIMKQVKNFVTTVKLVKRLSYSNCREYIINNYQSAGIKSLLDNFSLEIKKNNSVNKYWEYQTEKAEDHVRDAYLIFEHNINACLKLVLLFYEKANIEYQVLSKKENQMNYNILVNNFLYWSITNLEKLNFPVFKLYLSELGRINFQINQKIGRTKLTELIVKHRGETDQLFQLLKDIKIDIEKTVLSNQGSSDTVLFKPIKEKFYYNFNRLIEVTLPSIFNKFSKIKTQIEKIMSDHFSDFFHKMYPPFYTKTMIKLNKGMTEKTATEFIMRMIRVLLYVQARVYSEKFNLDWEMYLSRAQRLMDLLSLQLTEGQREVVKYLQEELPTREELENSHDRESLYLRVCSSLKNDYEKCIEDYNTNKSSREYHLYVLFSLFICFSGMELRRESGKLVFKQCEYTSTSRHILEFLSGIMRNYDYALNNWTVVNYMEYSVEDYLELFTKNNDDKVENTTDLSILEKLRNGQVEEVVEYFRGEMSRLKAYLRFSMDQDYKKEESKDNFDLEKALKNLDTNEYFFSLKPLFHQENGTNSRHILIFVSSFLNQAEDQEDLWKDYIKSEPYTECYAFTWPTMDTFSYNEIKIQMEQEYRDNNVKSDLFNIGVNLLANNHLKAIKLEKLDMNPPYSNLYYVAMLSGKALAFFLGQLKIFETSTVSLVGFSMGSVVTYNCLRDMYYMKKSNMIYNYVSIGCPLSRLDLNPEIIKLSLGSYFNIYSRDDKVLKYLASLVYFFNNPAGLSEVSYETAIYATKKIKVYNYDMTDSVHCHMDYTRFLKQIVEFVKRSEDYKTLDQIREDP